MTTEIERQTPGGTGEIVEAPSSTDRAQVPVVHSSVSELVSDATAAYLAELDPERLPTPREVERELIAKINFAIALENVGRPKNDQIPLAKSLSPASLAEALITCGPVRKIALSGLGSDTDYDAVGIYCSEGPREGTYLTSDDDLRREMRRYNRDLNLRGAKEVLAILRESAPRVTRETDRDLIAVNNGIFHYGTKELRPFSPEHVFLSKTSVDYVEDAPLPVITMPDGQTWDVETWMADLSDDEGVPELLWQITGAVIRPHVHWGKSAWYHSDRGNNGKGTLVALQRNIAGAGAWVSIPLDKLGEDFMLEQLPSKSCIITDENNVGTFIDKAANLKAIITNDVVMINRKHKMPISHQFWGIMIQCLNEHPRMKDTSDSFFRRQLYVPFRKWFGGEGVERKYIKDDYLNRKEVLEYVLHRVLVKMEDYYQLSEPPAVREHLEEFKSQSDPVRDFWREVSGELVNDELSQDYLYDLYRAWARRTAPDTHVPPRARWILALGKVAEEQGGWTLKKTKVRLGSRMCAAEPLSRSYDLEAWVGTQRVTGLVVPDWSTAPIDGAACGQFTGALLERVGARDAQTEVREEMAVVRMALEDDYAEWRGLAQVVGVDPEHVEVHAQEMRRSTGRCWTCKEAGREDWDDPVQIKRALDLRVRGDKVEARWREVAAKAKAAGVRLSPPQDAKAWDTSPV